MCCVVATLNDLHACGGEDGLTMIYKCSMTHNHHHCVSLYLEEEYEQFMLEAHWTSKSTIKKTPTKSWGVLASIAMKHSKIRTESLTIDYPVIARLGKGHGS